VSESNGLKIIQTVASGGTAVLYKAVQTSLDRIVAVKRLHGHLTDDENFTRRFILEAKAAASLDHENIVHIIDFGRHEEGYQMVMEFVEGESLKDVLERWRPIRYDLALSIIHQVCLGLEHAHAKGIVHRDIKPGNLMLTIGGKVKIADFGLAKLTQGATSHTAANSILGTPLYMSPEQAFGESVDQRSDLFSLGTVLYELLTGRQPFASENYMGVIQNIINKNIPPVSEFNPELPDEVQAITSRALSKERDNRFQTAREFREAIEDYIGIVELKNLNDGLRVLLDRSAKTEILHDVTPVRKVVRRRASRAGIAALVVFVLVAGATGAIIVDPTLVDRLRDGVVTDLPPAAVQTASIGEEAYQFEFAPLTPERDTVLVEKRDTVIIATQPEVARTNESVNETQAVSDARVEEKSAPVQDIIRNGFLNVESTPSVEVYIDGVYKGDTPVRLSLRAGAHTVECRDPRFESYKETLKITANELSRRNIPLKRLQGLLNLSTQDGAELYVDGTLAGRTPLMAPVKLDVGSHLITLKKEGHFTWSNELSIEANRTLPLRITLSPHY